MFKCLNVNIPPLVHCASVYNRTRVTPDKGLACSKRKFLCKPAKRLLKVQIPSSKVVKKNVSSVVSISGNIAKVVCRRNVPAPFEAPVLTVPLLSLPRADSGGLSQSARHHQEGATESGFGPQPVVQPQAQLWLRRQWRAVPLCRVSIDRKKKKKVLVYKSRFINAVTQYPESVCVSSAAPTSRKGPAPGWPSAPARAPPCRPCSSTTRPNRRRPAGPTPVT